MTESDLQAEQIQSSDSMYAGMRWLNRIVISGLACVFLYVIHFGPLVWGMEYLNITPGGGRSEVLIIVDYPHLSLMYHSENYFRYMSWYIGELDGSSQSWNGYRDIFENVISK